MATIFYPEEHFDFQKLEGKVLVVPSVSLANLPQLAVDVLITSLNLRRVGVVGDGTTVAPFAGADQDGETVTGGLTLYGRPENDVFFLQQRSPVLKSRKEDHVNLLSDFISSAKFECTLILTSLDAANQNDAQLRTPFQAIIRPYTTISSTHPILGRLRQLPPFSLLIELVVGLTSAPPDLNETGRDQMPLPPYPPFLPSAGLTRRILGKLQQEDLCHGALAMWCVEGDNREDARALAGTVLELLNIPDMEIRDPDSWKGLFGAVEGWSGGQGADSELYG